MDQTPPLSVFTPLIPPLSTKPSENHADVVPLLQQASRSTARNVAHQTCWGLISWVPNCYRTCSSKKWAYVAVILGTDGMSAVAKWTALSPLYKNTVCSFHHLPYLHHHSFPFDHHHFHHLSYPVPKAHLKASISILKFTYPHPRGPSYLLLSLHCHSSN